MQHYKNLGLDSMIAIGFLRCAVNVVESSLIDLRSSSPYSAWKRLVITEGALSLEHFSIGKPRTHAVFFEPCSNPGTTVMLNKCADGWESLFHVLNGRLKAEQILIRCASVVRYPIAEFKQWQHGNQLRCVRAFRDSQGWDFFESGVRQDFEDAAHYIRTKVSDRLQRKDLINYVKRLGWDVCAANLWVAGRSATHVALAAAGP